MAAPIQCVSRREGLPSHVFYCFHIVIIPGIMIDQAIIVRQPNPRLTRLLLPFGNSLFACKLRHGVGTRSVSRKGNLSGWIAMKFDGAGETNFLRKGNERKRTSR